LPPLRAQFDFLVPTDYNEYLLREDHDKLV